MLAGGVDGQWPSELGLINALIEWFSEEPGQGVQGMGGHTAPGIGDVAKACTADEIDGGVAQVRKCHANFATVQEIFGIGSVTDIEDGIFNSPVRTQMVFGLSGGEFWAVRAASDPALSLDQAVPHVLLLMCSAAFSRPFRARKFVRALSRAV